MKSDFRYGLLREEGRDINSCNFRRKALPEKARKAHRD